MENNALYVCAFLSSKGWTINAISAILANMQAESGVNPGIYENLNSNSTTNGYGLVQWTPNTKYKTWADDNGYRYGDIDGQLNRIIYELENGLQWIATDTYNMTFAEFSRSSDDVGDLAYAFMYNYERPASLDQPQRKINAETWLQFITNNGGATLPEANDKPKKAKEMSRLLFYFQGMRG